MLPEKRIFFYCLIILIGVSACYFAWNKYLGKETWPSEVKTVFIESSLDGSLQPSLFYTPPYRDTPAPLLVALHTWSEDYTQSASIPYFQHCKKNRWAFIHPNFRGPNINFDATGSDKAIHDILDAVKYAQSNSRIDNDRIYLVGCSGGGHAGLLVATRNPKLWAGVSLWSAVSDLKEFYYESLRKENHQYVDSLIKSCGGVPGVAATVDAEYERRSPVYYLSNAAGMNIDLNAGIHDGHNGSVPIRHTLEAFNLLCKKNGLDEHMLTEDEMKYFTEKENVPEQLKQELAVDLSYGKRKVLFRRNAGPVRITIFDGGHEIVTEAAMEWLSRQVKR